MQHYTWDDIFEAFGGSREVAKAIGVKPKHAAMMKHRQSIPSEYWVQLAERALEIGATHITYQLLASLKAAARRRAVEAKTKKLEAAE